MKEVVGRPGTRSSLALWVSQCVCAAASFAAMAVAHGSSHYTAFRALLFSMELQFFWSLFRAIADTKDLMAQHAAYDFKDVCWIVLFDWLMAIVSVASATASAGVAIYLERDFHICRTHPHLSCSPYKLSIILAFMAWSFITASAASSFWLLASFF
ncbi:hypothetical protein ACP70R_048502 [Stipagrostis hirtigluma subsp. patula]